MLKYMSGSPRNTLIGIYYPINIADFTSILNPEIFKILQHIYKIRKHLYLLDTIFYVSFSKC